MQVTFKISESLLFIRNKTKYNVLTWGEAGVGLLSPYNKPYGQSQDGAQRGHHNTDQQSWTKAHQWAAVGSTGRGSQSDRNSQRRRWEKNSLH